MIAIMVSLSLRRRYRSIGSLRQIASAKSLRPGDRLKKMPANGHPRTPHDVRTVTGLEAL